MKTPKTIIYKISSPIGELELEIYPKQGFTLWCKEPVRHYKTGRMLSSGHWIVDASCLKDDGLIRSGHCNSWSKRAVYNRNENAFKLINKKPNR